MDTSNPVKSLAINLYIWGNEPLQGGARGGRPPVFPHPMGRAAFFDPDAIHPIYPMVCMASGSKEAAIPIG